MPRIMAIDFGLKQIGVAVSDPLGITAQGVTVIKHKNNKTTLREISQLIVNLGVVQVVLGNPIRFGGGAGTLQETVENFGKKLSDATGVKVVMVDERLTTLQAEKMLVSADVSRGKRREVIDKIAAQLLLQGYLDSLPKRQPGPTD
ncbi:MAG: Holliday junction resolvase RuvX [Nitrospinae bacterium]|nr:Holliday junction resolvase RuvX [Nitrospinota bacterium]